MRKITLADHAGFCFGVTRAVETAYRELDKAAKEGAVLYALGPLIHNSDVTGELADKGLKTVKDINDIPDGSRMLIRAHGEPKITYDIAAEKNLEVIDATCPLVEKVHKIARRCGDENAALLVVGDKAHPEVKGSLGWTDGISEATEDPAEAAAFVENNKFSKLIVTAQTTITAESFEKCVSALKNTGIENLEIQNTRCPATQQRQDSAASLAKESDVMVVIGDEQSSNYRKLRSICQMYCSKIVTSENINLRDLPKDCKIGVAAGASTPASKIKEVIASMSETQNNQAEIFDMSLYMDDIEKSLKLPGRNETVDGSVVQVKEDYVVVNLGCKKDGMLPKSEVNLEEGQSLTDVFQEGMEISAKVLKTDDGDGNILLSTKRLQSGENWDELAAVCENKEIVNVTVVREIKGGVIANYKEVSGFIPMSQLADHYVETAEEYIGKTLPVFVTKVDPKKNKAVFSHKAYINSEREKKLAEVWEQLQVGAVVEGEVKRFTDYGAFVDIGGIDGLLHISEISWGKLKHPQEVLEIGQKIEVKILSMNAEKGKISLGYKQNNPEPWSVIDEKYSVGQIVTGKVVQLKEYGAFVELSPGLDGLVHISEIAYKRVNKVSDELAVGQEVQAKILDIDKEKKRISLSIKQTLEPPTADESKDEESKESDTPAEEAPAAEAPAEDSLAEEEAIEKDE